MATAPRAALATTALALLLPLSACTSDSGSNSDTDAVTSHSDGTRTFAEGSRDRVPALSGATVDGGKLDLSGPAYRGKVVVINTWSSWCPPCRAEAKHLAEVAAETRSRGVEFVGINTRDRGRSAAAAFEVGYPSLYDPHGKLLLRFPKGHIPVQGLPTTIVLDREGAIAAGRIGPVDAGRLRRMIDTLLGPSSGAGRSEDGAAG
ncbi:TlpA family protein disulfide reductase [Streptomyces sp. LE64]|uniref:TlpA family protein disulfide reductase n=1 Tax=Streptomyces sp. LE64 TaxID=3448653 RepID=UPI004042C089